MPRVRRKKRDIRRNSRHVRPSYFPLIFFLFPSSSFQLLSTLTNPVALKEHAVQPADSLRDSSRATSVSGHGTRVTCLLSSTSCCCCCQPLDAPLRPLLSSQRSRCLTSVKALYSAMVPENGADESGQSTTIRSMIEPSGSRFVAVLGNLAIGVCRTWLLGSRVKGRENEMQIIYACTCKCSRRRKYQCKSVK